MSQVLCQLTPLGRGIMVHIMTNLCKFMTYPWTYLCYTMADLCKFGPT